MKKTSLIFGRWNLFFYTIQPTKLWHGAVLKNKWSMENVHWDSVFLTFCNDLRARGPWISVAFPEKPRGLFWIITLGHSCSLSIFTKRFAFGLNRSDTFYRVRSARRYNKVNIILSRMRFRDSFIRNRTWMKMVLFKRYLSFKTWLFLVSICKNFLGRIFWSSMSSVFLGCHFATRRPRWLKSWRWMAAKQSTNWRLARQQSGWIRGQTMRRCHPQKRFGDKSLALLQPLNSKIC